jgi:pyruvate dehydrogenase E2 component (dihydrolipoamide acetyltransferase)
MNKEIVLATPYARKLADDLNIDISLIPGTGELGSVFSRDVLGFKGTAKITPVAKRMADYYKLNINDLENNEKKITKKDILELLDQRNSASVVENRTEDEILSEAKASPMRKMIAKRMLESMATAPQYTLFSEMDTTNLFDLIKSSNSMFTKLNGQKLTITDFLVKIVALALEKHPVINSSYDNDHITYHESIHMGVAVALDDGLIVPVIKDANKISIGDIHSVGKDLYKRAREGKILGHECAGSTFSISNMGMYPIDFATPIINQPESGILAVGQTQEKPVVIDGEITIRKMTAFSLTLDHRHIDGIEGCKFLKTLKELLQEPLCILL